MKTIYEIRQLGKEYCQTEGSGHYKKDGGLEPIDLLINNGLAEDFCIGNMVKYAIRFKKTRNTEDLKKVSDYAHILCGIELENQAPRAAQLMWNLHKLTEEPEKEVFSYEGFGD